MENWFGIDLSIITAVTFLIMGLYVTKLKDRVDELENELENLKFDILSSLRSRGFYHTLSSESIKLKQFDDDMNDGKDT